MSIHIYSNHENWIAATSAEEAHAYAIENCYEEDSDADYIEFVALADDESLTIWDEDVGRRTLTAAQWIEETRRDGIRFPCLLGSLNQ